MRLTRSNSLKTRLLHVILGFRLVAIRDAGWGEAGVMEMKLKTLVEKYFPIAISDAWNASLVGINNLRVSASFYSFIRLKRRQSENVSESFCSPSPLTCK